MTALFVLFIVFLGFVFIRSKLLSWALFFCFLVLVYWQRGALYRAKGIRLKMWATYFDYFNDSGKSIWLGFGPGTFEMVGPTIKFKIPGAADYGTAWMHNDWLQILWEYGAIVFFLSVGFYFYLLFRAYNKQTWLFCMVLGYGACMSFYSPLHFMISQLLACTLIVECLKKEA